jgi:hypothetical protein
MRKVILALVLGLAAQAAGAVRPEQPTTVYREGEVLVRYHGTAVDARAGKLKSAHGMTSRGTLSRGRLELLQLPRVTTTAAALEMLRRDPAVAHAEPNFLRFPRINCPDDAGSFCPDDPLFEELWGLRSIGQLNYASASPALASIPGADMDMLLAWDPGQDGTFERVGSPNVIIAIIDDAFLTSHEDLAANFLGVPGFDFGNNDANPMPDNTSQQHGTLVAGAAGAIGNNGTGVAGTAWNAKLMPLKFDFDSAGHLAALEFARDNGAQIINASFGGPGFSQEEEDALLDLAANDILYVTSAGNDDSNTDVAVLNYPSNLASPNIVSVAATNRQDQIASFSQYGAITTDVAAPGLQIVTTRSAANNSYSLPVNCTTTGSCGVTGTSFSAPYVAGIAALIRSTHTGATAAEVKARLIESAEPGDDVRLRTAGGRVNAAAALDITARPSLVISALDWTDANQRLDPGETLTLDVTIENLWEDAVSVSGVLSANSSVDVDATPVDFGTIATGATGTASFTMTVDTPIAQHRYVQFTLQLSANGGAYTTTRGFVAEVGRLSTDVLVTQDFVPRSVDLYDEFHAWHYDFDGVLPAGHDQLVIETTSGAAGVSSPDIDLLVKRNVTPQYNITVGVNPENPVGFFCTSGTTANCQDPDLFIDADGDGHEQVVINNPPIGTYHIVIVNFAHLENGLVYTLRAYTRAAPINVGGGGGGGGGLLGAGALGLLLLAALGRRAFPRR